MHHYRKLWLFIFEALSICHPTFSVYDEEDRSSYAVYKSGLKADGSGFLQKAEFQGKQAMD